MPQVNVLPIEPMKSLDSKGGKSDALSADSESGRRFGNEFERQLAAEESGKNNTSNQELYKKSVEAQEKSNVKSEHAKTEQGKEKGLASTNEAVNKPEHHSQKTDEAGSEEKSIDTVLDDPSSQIAENIEEPADKSLEFLSFLSASSKLIPEDNKVKNTQASNEESPLTVEDSESIDKLSELSKSVDKSGLKTPIDDVTLAKVALDKFNADPKNNTEKVNSEKSKAENASANNAFTTSDNNVVSDGKAKQLFADDKAKPEIKGELSKVHESIRNELKQLINNQNASVELSPEKIREAEAVVDKLLLKAGADVSLTQMKELLAKESLTKTNPLLNQLIQENDAENLINNKDAPFISKEGDNSLKGNSKVLSDKEKQAQEGLNITALNSNKASKETSALNDENVILASKPPMQDLGIAKTLSQEEKPASAATLIRATATQVGSENASLASSDKNASDSGKKSEDQDVDALISQEMEGLDSLKPKEEKLFGQNAQQAAPIARVDSHTSSATQVINESTRSEQSLDSLLNMIQSDTTIQTPKVLTPQQSEVISIYRKDFSNAVKEKVMVMINQKIQQVDIQLDPPEMGNIQVRVNLQNEQAVVTFNVQNQQAKEALEQNMGKLKDMLAQTGVDVGDANVNQQSNSQGDNLGNDGSSQSNGSQLEQSEDLMAGAQQLNVLKASSTGVDYYA